MLRKTPLKKKTGSALKRQKLTAKAPSTRKKTSAQAKLKKELWELCRKITAQRYPDVCFTCDKPISGANRQLGHFIPRSVGGTLLKYHLDNLRWQCYYDNINLGGNGSEFYRRLVKEIGHERVEELFEMKQQLVKMTPQFLREKIAEYTLILETVDNAENHTNPVQE